MRACAPAIAYMYLCRIRRAEFQGFLLLAVIKSLSRVAFSKRFAPLGCGSFFFSGLGRALLPEGAFQAERQLFSVDDVPAERDCGNGSGNFGVRVRANTEYIKGKTRLKEDRRSGSSSLGGRSCLCCRWCSGRTLRKTCCRQANRRKGGRLRRPRWLLPGRSGPPWPCGR
jgi:hypothetical protein